MGATNRHAAVADRLRDVARRDRAIELGAIARLAQQDAGESLESFGERLGLAALFDIRRLELPTALLELLQIIFGRAQRLSLGHQEIARIARLDVDHVAHLAELFDPFEQDHLHD